MTDFFTHPVIRPSSLRTVSASRRQSLMGSESTATRNSFRSAFLRNATFIFTPIRKNSALTGIPLSLLKTGVSVSFWKNLIRFRISLFQSITVLNQLQPTISLYHHPQKIPECKSTCCLLRT